jgi:hypothetical protein
MMFMMPMPPTTGETGDGTSNKAASRRSGRCFGDLTLVAHREIVVAPGSNIVTLAEQFGDRRCAGARSWARRPAH